MASYDYDLIVLGSGAGGSIAAQQVARAGKKVALVESGKFGGSEILGGRVPISALLQSAIVYENAKHGSRFGVRSTTVGYNYPTIKAWKDLVVKRTGIHSGERALINMGINVVRGRAHFIDPHTITIGAARFSSEEFLIASGSEATIPDVPGLTSTGFLTVADATNLTRPPKKLAIIGSDKYAVELAQLFAIFGSKVYIIDASPRLLDQEEPEVSETVEKTFKDTYTMSLLLESTLLKVESNGISKKLSVSKAGDTQTISVDEIIVASERKAATDIGLENAGVQYQDNAVLTDSTMATTANHIYAAGSCTGPHGSGHVAAYQSQIVAHNILHKRSPTHMDYRAVPRVLFTSPEIASVGPTERELKAAGISFKTVTVPLSVIARSNISDFSKGFVKITAVKKTNFILSATIVCPGAGEVVQELTLAIQHYLTTEQVARTIHAFPTWSEAIRVACSKLTRQ